MKVTGKNPAAVMTHAGEPILMRDGTAVTEATGWRLILNRLKGAAFREAWNEMIAEAVCHEVDDLNHCVLLNFSDQSVLGCRKGVKCWKPQVLFPPFTTWARARFRWRLVGASIVTPLKVGANNNQRRPPPRLRQFSPSRALSRVVRRKSCNQALGLRVVGAEVKEFLRKHNTQPLYKAPAKRQLVSANPRERWYL